MNVSSSNIVETGYTQGYRFTNKLGEDYKGFYFKDNKGKYWSGKNYTTNSVELINNIPPISLDPNSLTKNNAFNLRYTKMYNGNLDTPLLKTEYIEPSLEDYDKGIFVRCVAQLIPCIHPEKNIVEITSTTFYQIKDNPNIIKSYRLATFGWRINGPLEDIYSNNIRVEDGIISTNSRSLADVEKKIKGISLYLNDLLQFAAIPEKSEGFYDNQ